MFFLALVEKKDWDFIEAVGYCEISLIFFLHPVFTIFKFHENEYLKYNLTTTKSYLLYDNNVLYEMYL